jgi:hypothetical protein
LLAAAQAPSGVLLVDAERFRGRRFLHWHKVDGGVALTEISLDADLDNNFLVVLLGECCCPQGKAVASL